VGLPHRRAHGDRFRHHAGRHGDRGAAT